MGEICPLVPHDPQAQHSTPETSGYPIDEQLIETLRAQIPHIALRTSVIVGYPGETDEQFEELLNFSRIYSIFWPMVTMLFQWSR